MTAAQRIWQTLHVMRPALRLREQAEALADHVDPGDSVLDVGCGTGHLSAYLQQLYGVDPTGVDVKDFRQSEIPFQQFDGTSIPFPDNAFDRVVLSEVLHHSHDPMALIKECRRVARCSIIVFEDIPDGWLGKAILVAHVELFARYHRYPFKPARIAEYRKALAWLGDHAPCVARTPQPPEWFTLYPRVLLVYRATRSL